MGSADLIYPQLNMSSRPPKLVSQTVIHFFLQINDTAMGANKTPQYTNISMAILKQGFLSSHLLMPGLYFRFIDGILLDMGYEKKALGKFHQQFPPHQQPICEPIHTRVHFLDTTVLMPNISI